MIRLCSVKTTSRRWPVGVFCNVVIIDNWIISKLACKNNISRREYIQKVAEELKGSMPIVFLKRRNLDAFASSDFDLTPVTKQCFTFATSKCKTTPPILAKNLRNRCVGDILSKRANRVHNKFMSLYLYRQNNYVYLIYI